MIFTVTSLLFTIAFVYFAFQSHDSRQYGLMLLAIFMAVMNGTIFVLKLMEAIY